MLKKVRDFIFKGLERNFQNNFLKRLKIEMEFYHSIVHEGWWGHRCDQKRNLELLWRSGTLSDKETIRLLNIRDIIVYSKPKAIMKNCNQWLIRYKN